MTQPMSRRSRRPRRSRRAIWMATAASTSSRAGRQALTVWRTGGGGTRRADRCALDVACQQSLGRRRQDRDARRQPPAAARDLCRHPAPGRPPTSSSVSAIAPARTWCACCGHPASCRQRPAPRRRKNRAGPVALLPPARSRSKSSIANPRRVRFSTRGMASASSSSPTSSAAARWGTGSAPGERNTPDPDEYVRIDGEQLKSAQRPLRVPHHERARRVAVPRSRCSSSSSPIRRASRCTPTRVSFRSRDHSRSSPQNGRNRRSLPATTRAAIVLAALAHVDRHYADGFALERDSRLRRRSHTQPDPAGPRRRGPPAAAADGVDRLCVLRRQRGGASGRADAAPAAARIQGCRRRLAHRHRRHRHAGRPTADGRRRSAADAFPRPPARYGSGRR